MPTPVRAAVFPIVLSAALAACGGGGGGGGSTIREVPFSFSAIAPNQTVVLTALSGTGEGTYTEGTPDSLLFGGTAASFDVNPAEESSSTLKLTYDGGRNISGIDISTPSSSMSFGAEDLLCEPAACVAISSDITSIALVINPLDPMFGWNYQTFGVWLKDASSTSFQLGAISAGAVSPASALPLSTGTFTGHALGWWIDAGGALHTTHADMTAIANFSARKIDFSTSDTTIDGLAPVKSDLNLRGILDYGTGNQFSGTVTAARIVDPLSGTATGRFYGPNAEEIGGVYGLGSTTTGESMIGGFGGKR